MGQQDEGRTRVNITMDTRLLKELDALISLGAVKQGRRTYRQRSTALEYIVNDWIEKREEGMTAVANYFVSGKAAASRKAVKERLEGKE